MKVFLSCVSSEFRSYRLKLANQLGALKGQPYEVKVQEDFDQGGFTLLEKLADYLRECDLVIHMAGDACGAQPTAEHVRTLFANLGVPAPEPLPERSYTQWEFDLAQRFGRPTLCYIADDRLSEPARQLLRLLSWLAPDPIPESLLEAGGGPFAAEPANDGDASSNKGSIPQPDARDALAELSDHSLAKHSDEEPTFSVHRLVQDVTRNTLPKDEKLRCLKQALRWVDDALVGNPQDVRNWPVLVPLVPHAQAIATFADLQDVPEPTGRLMNMVGLLFSEKARYAEAEPLMRCVLKIEENSYGPDHPIVATCLNNLASLLQATNRLAEAEPLMRRALKILVQFTRRSGHEHPNLRGVRSNYVSLLDKMGFGDEEIQRKVDAILESDGAS